MDAVKKPNKKLERIQRPPRKVGVDTDLHGFTLLETKSV